MLLLPVFLLPFRMVRALLRTAASGRRGAWFLAVPFLVGCLLSVPARGAVGVDGAPGDAPALAGDLPKVPAVPSSFNTHDGGWIVFEYPAALRQRIQPLIADADLVRRDLSAYLGEGVLARVRVRVARTPGEMVTLAPEGAPFPKYAAGVAYSRLGLVLLTMQPVHPNAHHDLREVFRHELAHVALHDAVGGRHVPRWFNEGFAVHASNESSLLRLQSLAMATTSDRLLTLDELETTFPEESLRASVASAQAADVVRFLVRRQDQERFATLIDKVRSGDSFDASVEYAYGVDLDTLELEWREDVAKRYTFWPIFFSSSVVWMAVIGLFVWGWRRRRLRDRVTLARWEREEAEEARRRTQVPEQPRLHVVLARPARPPPLPVLAETDVPKVEHDGQWHTLH